MNFIYSINNIIIRILDQIPGLDFSELRSSNSYQAIAAYSHSQIGAIITSIVLLITLIAIWRILRKASEPGWVAIIPIVNLFYLFRITFGSGWFILLMLIPVVNIIVGIIYVFRLSHSFGHGFLFAPGLIFLSPIFYWILGFGKDYYLGPNGK